jgi:hypothetical protein
VGQKSMGSVFIIKKNKDKDVPKKKKAKKKVKKVILHPLKAIVIDNKPYCPECNIPLTSNIEDYGSFRPLEYAYFVRKCTVCGNYVRYITDYDFIKYDERDIVGKRKKKGKIILKKKTIKKEVEEKPKKHVIKLKRRVIKDIHVDIDFD